MLSPFQTEKVLFFYLFHFPEKIEISANDIYEFLQNDDMIDVARIQTVIGDISSFIPIYRRDLHGYFRKNQREYWNRRADYR